MSLENNIFWLFSRSLVVAQITREKHVNRCTLTSFQYGMRGTQKHTAYSHAEELVKNSDMSRIFALQEVRIFALQEVKRNHSEGKMNNF